MAALVERAALHVATYYDAHRNTDRLIALVRDAVYVRQGTTLTPDRLDASWRDNAPTARSA